MLKPVQILTINLIDRTAALVCDDYRPRPMRPLSDSRLFKLLATLNSLQDLGHCQIWARTNGIVATRADDPDAAWVKQHGDISDTHHAEYAFYNRY